jgi:hypothetical protein
MMSEGTRGVAAIIARRRNQQYPAINRRIFGWAGAKQALGFCA